MHFAFMNQSFFNGPHEDISEQWSEWRAHGDAMDLFIKLSIELERLVFGGCFEKICKFHSAQVQVVCFIDPVIHKRYIGEYLYCFL